MKKAGRAGREPSKSVYQRSYVQTAASAEVVLQVPF